MKRWWITTAVALAVAGCAGIPNQEAFRTVVNSWQGHNVNDVINAWGPPVSTFKKPDGNTVYTYHEGGVVASACTVDFTVDGQQTIIGWRFTGTECRTTY